MAKAPKVTASVGGSALLGKNFEGMSAPMKAQVPAAQGAGVNFQGMVANPLPTPVSTSASPGSGLAVGTPKPLDPYRYMKNRKP